MASPNTHQLLIEKYAAMIEAPGFKLSELIIAMEGDYKMPAHQLSTKEILHLAIRTGQSMKLSALDLEKL